MTDISKRDKLVESLCAQLREASETIGGLKERLEWYKATVSDYAAAHGIATGDASYAPPEPARDRHGLEVVR